MTELNVKTHDADGLPLLVGIASRLGQIDDRLGAIEERLEADAAERQLTDLAEAGQLVFNTVALVESFHTAFGVPVKAVPVLPDAARVALRMDLIEEEVGELRRALIRARETGAADAMVKVAKELADVQYVLDGTFLEFGLGALKSHIVNAVHASNMTLCMASSDSPSGSLPEAAWPEEGPDYVAPDAAIAEVLEGYGA